MSLRDAFNALPPRLWCPDVVDAPLPHALWMWRGHRPVPLLPAPHGGTIAGYPTGAYVVLHASGHGVAVRT